MPRLVWTLPDQQTTARWAEDEGGSGSQDLASVLAVGGDPDGNPVTGPLTIDSLDAATPALTIQTRDAAQSVAFLILGFNGSDSIFVVNDLGEASLYPQALAGGGLDISTVSGGPAFGLLKVQLDSSPTFSVDADGSIYAAGPIRAYGGVNVHKNSVPADGDLTDGEVAIWFDSTDGDGNTKVMFKGKSANGTVKTASIVLA